MQNFFYLSQSIFAILGIIVFIILAALLVQLFKKIDRLEKRLDMITEKGMEVADGAKNMVNTGQKVLLYGVYRIFKRGGRRRYEDDSCW